MWATPGTLWAAEGKTLWSYFQTGGIIMWPLLICSIAMVGLILECSIRLRVGKAAPPQVVSQLQNATADGNYQEAWRVCNANPCFLTNVMAPALQRLGRGKEVVRTILEEHGAKEALGWRARIGYLSLIGVITPMLGLLGTVTGMIRAFDTLATAGAISDPTRLSGAIGEALITTAGGLFAGVPAFVAYFFFRNRIQDVLVVVEDKINALIEDVPYEQLQGIKVGPQLEAELAGGTAFAGAGTGVPAVAPEAVGMPTPAPTSGAVLAPCPNCNAQIPQGIPNCPNCKAQLEWA